MIPLYREEMIDYAQWNLRGCGGYSKKTGDCLSPSDWKKKNKRRKKRKANKKQNRRK